MAKSYSDYVRTGQMDQVEAIKHNTIREQSRQGVTNSLKAFADAGLPADAAAFGALDVVAVKLVEWYGAEAAGKVFRHYAEVCERQKDMANG